jgi:pimeloyl-ACP methyl ester carboxylesterase
VEEQTIELHGSPVFVRQAPVPASTSAPAGAPVLYLHSLPSSSDDWRELLERTGGFAPDLPGFGRSGKGGHLDYSLGAYMRFIVGLLDALRVDRVSVVAHGWGATAALLAGASQPERVTRIALIAAVPPLDGIVLPRAAQWLRRPMLGELVMGSVTRRWLARILRGASGNPTVAWPDAAVDAVWSQFDQGTQRAILRLLRSASPAALAAGRAAPEQMRCPALVLTGTQDRWSPPSWADALAQRLPAATLELVDGAGHWPWREQPQVAERIVRWLTDPVS